MAGPIRALLAGVAGTIIMAATAQAGGFSRGTADTDILFEEGNFNMRTGATIVAPQRDYETITNSPSPASGLLGLTPGATVDGTDGTYSNTYVVPSSAIKLNLTDDARCAGTHTQSFGANASYGPQAILAGQADGTGLVSREFSTYELGLTCAYKFNTGPIGGLGNGRAWIIGGVFLEDLTFTETVRFSGPVLGAGGLDPAIAGALDGTDGVLAFNGEYELGYRIGVAFEVPEIAARAQLLYRSAVNHNPGGTFTALGSAVPTSGAGTLPQSVELKVQSGVAPGTLVFGSVKWTDWSVFDQFNYSVLAGPLAGPRDLEFAWTDGWTVSAGVGRQFNDWLSGSVNLTWDQGVSTTEDVFTDTWTLASGVAITGDRGELRFGGAISYLTAGSVAPETDPQTPTTIQPGSTFGYSVGNDISYAVGGSLTVNW